MFCCCELSVMNALFNNWTLSYKIIRDQILLSVSVVRRAKKIFFYVLFFFSFHFLPSFPSPKSIFGRGSTNS